MKTIFLLFSHTLTEDQLQDAEKSLGTSRVVALPEDLQKKFSNVPPDLITIAEYLQPIEQWLLNQAKEGDYALIQGDFGATHYLVNQCKNKGVIPVYATTERQSIDQVQTDGSVVTQRIFKHKMFRKYE